MDKIAKERLNIILLVDASKSMQGKRIHQVDQAIADIKNYLVDLQDENSNVDFYITIIPFSTEASFYDGKDMVNIKDFDYHGIKCGGWSNLHLAYEKLGQILQKQAKGGIMPDFGGVAPIILLLSDGHPTKNTYKAKLEEISTSPWFKAALRYGVAIELGDERTCGVLRDFAGNNGDVIKCYDSGMLKDIIKIIVITASQVKSSSSNASYIPQVTQNKQLQQVIAEALSETEDLEW